jgi:single-strand DNA-binding protein
MRSVNRVTLLGCLGKDAETKYMPSGVALTTFSLATSRSVKDSKSGEYHDETDWHNVALWRAEKLAEYLRSGVRVYIEGRLETRRWEDNEGSRHQRTQIVADQVILLGDNGKSRGRTPPNGGGQRSSRAPEPQARYAGGQDGF